MSHALFIFRRDLRLADNTGLNEAFRKGGSVLPLFIVDEQLIERWQDSEKRLAFMFQSVAALAGEIKAEGGSLLVRAGHPEAVVKALLAESDISAVYVNREYTPLGNRRDDLLASVCRAARVAFHAADDAVLNPPGTVAKADGNPYTVFTPYFRKAKERAVPAPATREAGSWVRLPGDPMLSIPLVKHYLDVDAPTFTPGSGGAAKALDRICTLANYDETRDIPASGQTSRLSAHLRFGTCSPREVRDRIASELGPDHPLIRQLYWRDFYVQIGYHFPHVFGHAFRRQYDRIEWRADQGDLQCWRDGRTGFPIIDAGMRELAETGTMHNRVRMVVASFLTKNLHLDWRLGEAHFARHLIDYDPAVNNGNWQWAASTGCDAQPYFRVFNPWRQQQKFDRDCVYIKRWIPALRPYPPRAIHGLEQSGDFYLPRMVDLRRSAEVIKSRFKAAASQPD